MKSSVIKAFLYISLTIAASASIMSLTNQPNNHKEVKPSTGNSNLVELTTKLPSIMVKGKLKLIPIQLSELKVSTIIVGTVAITTMDMLFYNDSTRVLSGDLYFPLNEGQTVSRFALDVNGVLREGVVVEKAKARVAYERMIRRGVDPGLVELTKGNNFKTRIYPIPAKGFKTRSKTKASNKYILERRKK